MRPFLIAALILVVLNTQAQKIKVISATSQSWSGGVAGHHGTNYNITIEISDTTITPDTLWVQGFCYPLSFTKTDMARKVDKKHKTVRYYLSAAEWYNDMEHIVGSSSKINYPDKNTKHPAKQYQGAALITYPYKGKECSFLLKAFTVLSALCYP